MIPRNQHALAAFGGLRRTRRVDVYSTLLDLIRCAGDFLSFVFVDLTDWLHVDVALPANQERQAAEIRRGRSEEREKFSFPGGFSSL